ncbi:MAG: carbonic anhydrase [Bryobacteraceae bacterium]|nr:carbonic anhydrase [Bryobacteraceae bacterium]
MANTQKGRESLQKLMEGVRRFRLEVYPTLAEVYRGAVEEGQKPHTLFITCADSRVDPELITQSGPGELFVTRNIGNLVPTYGEAGSSVSAVIEYAVNALGVQHIVVCGHTDCGAMKAMLSPGTAAALPTVGMWLRNADAALSIVKSRKSGADDGKEQLAGLIEENVLMQVMHLRTHPSVAGRLDQGDLSLHGWVFDISHGVVRMHDPEVGRFVSEDQRS